VILSSWKLIRERSRAEDPLETHSAVIARAGLAPALLSAQPTPPARDYLVLVANESVDRVALIRFGPSGAKVEKERYVGWAPTQCAGRTASLVSPDKRYFVSRARIRSGRLTNTTRDERGGRQCDARNFPATAQVSPDRYYVYVVNFNLHGDMVPSDVSVVAADDGGDRAFALHDAARFAHERRWHEALFRVHDG
jgi:hypothetical protein